MLISNKLRGTPIRLPLSLRLLLFICVFFYISSYCQDLKIQYLYNPTNKNKEKEEMLMTLRIGKESSYYYNEDTFRADSLRHNAAKPSLEIPSLKSDDFCFIKKVRPSKNILVIVNVWRTIYKVSEDVDIPWKVLPDTDTFLGYKIQKATGRYGGRDWEAWFAPDIPIGDGPYKFFGLPGMVLKVHDDRLQHVFTAVSIKKIQMLREYPFGSRFDYGGSISYDAYKKIYKKFIDNPETQMENILRMPDNNRNIIRRQEVEAIKKRNAKINPIELY